MSWESDFRREDMIRQALYRYRLKYTEREPTDFEKLSSQVSYYDLFGRPDMMPELSPERVCFSCGHPWEEHGSGGCNGTCYVWVDEDTRQPRRCGCGRSR